MAVIRGVLPSDNFTIMDNRWIDDDQLSAKAKGLLLMICRHAPGYTLTTERLIAQCSDGRDAVRAGLMELERTGYLRRVAVREAGGRVVRYDFELSTPDRVAEETVAAEAADGLAADGTTGGGFAGGGKPATSHEQPKLTVVPGRTGDGFSGDGQSNTYKTKNHKTKKTPERTTSSRGTRIPADFTVTDSMRTWAHELATEIGGRPPGDQFAVLLDRWTAEFIDYWTARAGRDAVKLDWVATWRNRVRTKLDDAAKQAGQPGNALALRNGSNGHRPSTTDQRVAAALALADELEQAGNR
jgi:hypothetical protein